jgi:hypothetical protein
MADGDLILKREVAAALVALKRPLLNDTKLEVSDVIKLATDELVLRLEKFIYTSPLGVFEVEYPAGPWEHFRAVYFKRFALGRWFLRRKPVRMHYERRSAAVSFPESTWVFPDDLGKPVILVRDEYHNYT